MTTWRIDPPGGTVTPEGISLTGYTSRQLAEQVVGLYFPPYTRVVEEAPERIVPRDPKRGASAPPTAPAPALWACGHPLADHTRPAAQACLQSQLTIVDPEQCLFDTCRAHKKCAGLGCVNRRKPSTTKPGLWDRVDTGERRRGSDGVEDVEGPPLPAISGCPYKQECPAGTCLNGGRCRDADRSLPPAGSTPATGNDIAATLVARGSKYGEFRGHAKITQELKDTMRSTTGWLRLSDDKRESLDMIVHKIGRILNGDPEFHDSWHDIVGYAQLAADRVKKDK